MVVRIKAASLNFRDLVVVRGQYDRDPTPGRVPLSDGAGEVQKAIAGHTSHEQAIELPDAFFKDGLLDASRPKCIGRHWAGQLTVFCSNRQSSMKKAWCICLLDIPLRREQHCPARL